MEISLVGSFLVQLAGDIAVGWVQQHVRDGRASHSLTSYQAVPQRGLTAILQRLAHRRGQLVVHE